MAVENVFFCRGSAMELADLNKAGVQNAEVIIILQDQQAAYASLYNRSVDSFAIFVTNAVDEFFPNTRWVSEIVEEGSLAKLECLPEDRSEAYGMWPRYVSGMVYLSSSLDGLLAQSFYNEDLLGIVSKLVGLSKSGHGGEGGGESGAVEHAEIAVLAVPIHYVRGTYSELYKDLAMNHGVVPLGIFREQEVYNPSPPLPVVLTNPDPTMPLYQSDRIFVLRMPYNPALHGPADKAPFQPCFTPVSTPL